MKILLMILVALIIIGFIWTVCYTFDQQKEVDDKAKFAKEHWDQAVEELIKQQDKDINLDKEE